VWFVARIRQIDGKLLILHEFGWRKSITWPADRLSQSFLTIREKMHRPSSAAHSHIEHPRVDLAEALRNQVAFHAERAAEKAFKAVLVHAAVEFPRTHDLQSLLLLLRNSGISVRPEIGEAAALTRFAVEARYPGDIEPITPEEVALAIEIAETASRGRGSKYAKSREPGERAVQLEYPLFGHNVLVGRYFNVDSNKCSNKKRANHKWLKTKILQTENSALLRRWFWVRVPANPLSVCQLLLPGKQLIEPLGGCLSLLKNDTTMPLSGGRDRGAHQSQVSEFSRVFVKSA
jgi:HEPN domain-containing protein